TMKSSLILENFLGNNSSLQSFVPYEIFIKLMPPDCLDKLCQLVYEELQKQRKSESVQHVTKSILQEFDVPVTSTTDIQPGSVLRARSITSIEKRLNKLCDVLVSQNSSLDYEIAQLISTTEGIIQLLSDLRYGRNSDSGKEKT
ncbi:uncharacterized protein CANTADRAFT_30346, partial [Suhomyces tanzawaensis NRRL Y-17324]